MKAAVNQINAPNEIAWAISVILIFMMLPYEATVG
jgi:hypothetical protein